MTTIPDTSTPLAHALAYAELGWRVVPIIPGKKAPKFDDWPDLATTDTELINQWWSHWPDHGVGLACGPASGFWALDVDPDKGGDETLRDLEASHGALPDTVQALTGGGGTHYLFRWPTLAEDQYIPNEAGRCGPGLDVRADRGQVVAAPTVHPDTGARYEWEVAHLPGVMPIADAPAWLLELVIEKVEPLPEGQVAASEAADLAYARDRFDFGEGWHQRHVDLLMAHGWHSPRTDRRGVTFLVRPGKTRWDGQGASVGKIPGVTYIFTDGAPPLEPGGYRAHRLLEVLECDGDAAAADRRAIELVGGAPSVPDPAATQEWITGLQRQAVADAGVVLEVRQFLAQPMPDHDWLVPGLLERGDRLILTGREGMGKSTLLRQMAVQMAAGIAPFDGEGYEPVKVLLVDLENSKRHLRRKLGPLVAKAGPGLRDGRLYIAAKPEGLDLGAAADADWLRAVCGLVGPDVVITGPIYKMSDGDPTEETTAKPVIRLLDELRAAYDCAMVIEAHTPSETGNGKRYERPYGASIWRRWPEFGLFLDERGPLRHWRGARDEREWPTSVERGAGTDWPWIVVNRGATYMAMVEVQRAAAKPLSVRGVAQALEAVGKGGGASKSTIERAIAANRRHWDALLEELFGSQESEAEVAPWEA